MKKTLIFFLFLLGLSTLQAQYELARYVPKDAALVIALNAENLDSKVSIEELKKVGFINMGLNMAGSMGGGPAVQQFVNDPNSVGLDMMQPMYFFMDMGENGMKTSLAVKVIDSKKLSDFIAEIGGSMAAVQKTDGFEYIETPEGVMSWNNEIMMFSNVEMQWSTEDYENDWDEMKKKQQEATMAYVKSAMSPANSILSVPSFQKEIDKADDLTYWVNYPKVMTYTNQMSEEFGGDFMGPYQGMIMNMAAGLYEDIYIGGSLNSQDGAMVLETNYSYNEQMETLMESGSNIKSNKKYARYIPQENLLGYYSFSYDLETIGEGIEEMTMPLVREMPMFGEMAAEAIEVLDIIIDEDAIYELIEGDMVLAFTGLKEFERTEVEYDEEFNAQEYTVEETLPIFNLMLTTGDPEEMSHLFKLGKAASVLLPGTNNSFKLSIPGEDLPMDIFLAMKEDIVFITNDQELVENRLVTELEKENMMAKQHRKMLKKNSQVFFVDLPKTMETASQLLPPDAQGPQVQGMIENFRSVFRDLTFTTKRKVKDQTLSSEVRMNFIDKDRNGLEQILYFANELVFAAMSGS